MIYKQMLEDIFHSFEEDIQKNPVLKEIFTETLQFLSDDMSVIGPRVNPKYLPSFITKYHVSDEFLLSGESNICYFIIHFKDQLIDLRFKKLSTGEYYFNFRFITFFDHQTKNIDLYIKDKRSRVDSVIYVENHEKIVAYDNHTYFYQEDQLLDIDTKEIEDKNFASEFQIPVLLADFYRKNFSQYVDYLNEQRQKDVYACMEKLNPADQYTFYSPFLMKNLREFLTFEYQRELEIDGTLPIDEQKYKNMSDYLIRMIGEDSEVVLSRSLFNAMTYHIYNFEYDVQYINGYLIRKEENGYTLFRVYIENNEPCLASVVLSKEDAKSLYLKGSYEEKNEALEEFFGISRGR